MQGTLAHRVLQSLWLLLLVITPFLSYAQNTSSLIISGTTNKRIDYFTKDGKIRKKYDIKDLGGVKIDIIRNDRVVASTISDNHGGKFKIKFDFQENQVFDMVFSKKGFYSKKSRIKTLDAEMGYDYQILDYNIALRAEIEGLERPSRLLPFEQYVYDEVEQNFLYDYEYEIDYNKVQEEIYAKIEQEVKSNDAYANLRDGELKKLMKELREREAETMARIKKMEDEQQREYKRARDSMAKMIKRSKDSLSLVYASINAEKNRIENIKPKVQYIYIDSSKTTIKSEQKITKLKDTDKIDRKEDMDRAGMQIIRIRDEIADAKKQLKLDKLLAKTKEDSLLIHQREMEIMAAENEIMGFEAKVKDANQKLKLQKLTLKNQRMILYGLVGFVLLLAGFFIIVYRLYNQKKKVNNLLSEKNAEIEEKNNDILASIRYAQRIQTAILPPDEALDEKIRGEYFILYKPKDIVSGDFYWMAEKDDKLYISAIDCTGHGVPGAFMSMIGYNSLNKAVIEFKDSTPAEILDRQNKFVSEALRKDSNPKIKDGMDMAMLCIDYKNRTVQYAGAYNPLYLVRNGEMIHTQSDRISIGSYFQDPDRKFQNHTFNYQSGDCFYIFTDGYADQFGGPDFRKYMHRSFREHLVQIYNEPMKKQKELLLERIESWRGEEEQVDDMCVIGVRLT